MTAIIPALNHLLHENGHVTNPAGAPSPTPAMKQEQLLDMVSREEAERRFREALGELVPTGVEVIPIDRALGRVLAVAHLFDPASGEYNTPFLAPRIELVRGYDRLQGVVFRPGDARFEDREAEEAVREAVQLAGIVMVNRNRGSDARPAGYGVEASSHHAIAAAVAQGRADFGVAIDIVAKDRGLGFLHLAEERYDFFVPEARRRRPAVQAFFEELDHEETRAALIARGLLP